MFFYFFYPTKFLLNLVSFLFCSNGGIEFLHPFCSDFLITFVYNLYPLTRPMLCLKTIFLFGIENINLNMC